MPLVVFDPQPRELPGTMPSPFAHDPPPPVARRAADELVRFVDALAPELRGPLEAPGGGKMFGVLVVRAPDGRLGYLRAFSGMLGGRWHVDGFVGPTYDEPARAAVWPAGEAELARVDAALAELDREAAPLRAAHAELTTRHNAEAFALKARHAEARARRALARPTAADPRALDDESSRDGAERRALRARHQGERAALEPRLAELAAARAALVERRSAMSRGYLRQIYETYRFANARGEWRTLYELFAPHEPPGGAGDCAAPKLFAHAYREGLVPLAIAELWIGAPPLTGGRHAGSFYPACRGKCGPILAHVLEGLAVEPAPVFGIPRVGEDEPRVVYDDRWLVVVDKPCGLLSVPGRGAALQDTVLARLRRRYPECPELLLGHRLDLDTSGLLVVAKDEATYTRVQAQFAQRLVDKRYVAVLEGEVRGDAGTIELPLRVDVDDRPRHVVDPVHGKRAVTEWRVLSREGARTRVALVPRTGRTHQLRVHAAHPAGLGAPIAGDRLYGRAGERLLLHAEHLRLAHPHTGATIELESPAPF